MPDDRDRTDEDERDLVAALTEQARDVAAWDNDRIHGFERKAGTLLGAAGTVLTILLGVVTLIERGPQGSPPTWPMVVATVLLIVSVVAATVCLMPWKTSYVSVAQLKETWRNSTKQIEDRDSDVCPVSPIAAQAITVRALLEGQPAKKARRRTGGGDRQEVDRKAVPAGLDSLRKAATIKAWAFRVTVGSFVAGVIVAGAIVLLTIKGVMS